MAELTLVIGNRNYSSWSLRGWLALDATGTNFVSSHLRACDDAMNPCDPDRSAFIRVPCDGCDASHPSRLCGDHPLIVLNSC